MDSPTRLRYESSKFIIVSMIIAWNIVHTYICGVQYEISANAVILLYVAENVSSADIYVRQ